MNGKQNKIYPHNKVLLNHKKNKVLIHASTWMNHENIMLSERDKTHTQKILHNFIHMKCPEWSNLTEEKHGWVVFRGW